MLILKRRFHRTRKQLKLIREFFFHRQLVEQVAGKINAANSARDNRVERNFVDVRKQVESRDWKNRTRYNNLVLTGQARRRAVSSPEGYKSRLAEETATMRT